MMVKGKRSPFMKSDPDYQIWLKNPDEYFEGPKEHSAKADSAARLSGFFCAPSDGKYEFKMTSDDSSR